VPRNGSHFHQVPTERNRLNSSRLILASRERSFWASGGGGGQWSCSIAAALVVDDGDAETLRGWLRSGPIRSSLARRARIVLLAAEGLGPAAIAQRVGCSKQMVITWRQRYRSEGVAGLADAPRSGRPPTVDEAAVIAATLEPPPARLGVTHWSTRLLAAQLGISNVGVGNIWRAWGIQPHRADLQVLHRPGVGDQAARRRRLYLDPPERVVVLCVDEKSPIQALEAHRSHACGASWAAARARLRSPPSRHHHPVRRAGDRHPQGHPPVPAPPPPQEFLRLLR
jgi:transposase